MSAEVEPYWVLMWREGEDWGWLCSLDGNKDCTTQAPVNRLRYGTPEAAKAAKWRFIRDNPKRDNEAISVARVTVRRKVTP